MWVQLDGKTNYGHDKSINESHMLFLRDLPFLGVHFSITKCHQKKDYTILLSVINRFKHVLLKKVLPIYFSDVLELSGSVKRTPTQDFLEFSGQPKGTLNNIPHCVDSDRETSNYNSGKIRPTTPRYVTYQILIFLF